MQQRAQGESGTTQSSCSCWLQGSCGVLPRRVVLGSWGGRVAAGAREAAAPTGLAAASHPQAVREPQKEQQ